MGYHGGANFSFLTINNLFFIVYCILLPAFIADNVRFVLVSQISTRTTKRFQFEAFNLLEGF